MPVFSCCSRSQMPKLSYRLNGQSSIGAIWDATLDLAWVSTARANQTKGSSLQPCLTAPMQVNGQDDQLPSFEMTSLYSMPIRPVDLLLNAWNTQRQSSTCTFGSVMTKVPTTSSSVSSRGSQVLFSALASLKSSWIFSKKWVSMIGLTCSQPPARQCNLPPRNSLPSFIALGHCDQIAIWIGLVMHLPRDPMPMASSDVVTRDVTTSRPEEVLGTNSGSICCCIPNGSTHMPQLRCDRIAIWIRLVRHLPRDPKPMASSDEVTKDVTTSWPEEVLDNNAVSICSCIPNGSVLLLCRDQIAIWIGLVRRLPRNPMPSHDQQRHGDSRRGDYLQARESLGYYFWVHMPLHTKWKYATAPL